MSSRTVPGLRKPPTGPKGLAGFPRGLATGTRFRAHDQDYGPWYFAATPSDPRKGGRFDLPAPFGTCYVAADIEAAVRERLGPRYAGRRWIPDSARLRSTAVSRLNPGDRPTKGYLANTTAKKASRWVTREISTTLDYLLTQQWAASFCAAGYAGVKYTPRLSTGSTLAEAWFATAGPHPLPYDDEPEWLTHIPLRRRTIRVKNARVID